MNKEVMLVARNLNNEEHMGTKELLNKVIESIALAVSSRKDFRVALNKAQVKYYFQKNNLPWVSSEPEDLEEVDEETLNKIQERIKSIIAS